MNPKTSNEELGRLSPEEFQSAEKHPIVLVLDQIRSLNNVGSAFRTADAFGLEAIYLCGISATPPHREIRKTALGATETVRWKYFKNTLEAIEDLKSKGYLILSIEQAQESVFLQDFELKQKQPIALVFGHEVNGVEQAIIDASDQVIEIPQFGTKHSLNVSVSLGLVVWDILSKHFISATKL